MPTYEGLRLRVLDVKRKVNADARKRRLKETNFTIISNNCWGGMVYESYNLPKNSPTVGLFFIAKDYIRFVSDLQGYISEKLIFIKPEESKWKGYFQEIKDESFGKYPIGRLKDVEIFFLHYHNEQEALEKWERRCERINWEKLLVKFNDQNGCTADDVVAFMHLPIKNKLFFTCKMWPGIPTEKYICIKQFPKHDHIMASFEPFGKNKYINLNCIINNL